MRPCRLNEYSSLLEHRHGLPVWTVVLLMRPEADSPRLTGVYECSFPGEEPYRRFRYHVVRVWQTAPDVFLDSGVGLLPLAPLSRVAEADLPAVLRRMEERIRLEVPPQVGAELWTITGVLMGMRYPPDQIARLLQGVHGMKES